MAIIVEGQLPYTAGDGIEITANKVIKVLLREENNLIKLNEDNELYTDLQLVSGITPSDEFPVGVTVGQVLKKDGWLVNGTILNFQTTSGDYGRWLYGADGHMYYDHGTGTFTQIYSGAEVDALFTQLRGELSTVAFTGDYNDLKNRPEVVAPSDGELTISKNGEPVGTFTANQATDETIDIEVPTTVAELDDASDYAKFTDLAPVATSGDYNDLDNKPTIPVVNDGTLTIQKNGTNVATFTANQSGNQTANITVPTTVAELTDSGNYVTDSELSTALGDYTPTANLAAVALSNSYTDLDNKPTIPTVINSLTSTDTNNALSAAKGKELSDRIDSALSLGRFLSLWNSSTGMPISFPLGTPYTYKTGDWFMVEIVGTTNYMPNGSSYTGTASTTVDTNDVAQGDVYIYDGTNWLFQDNNEVQVSFANLAGQPSDNANLAAALNAKANSADLATVATSGSYNDLSNKPTIGNATLTIQKNGTNVATFGANATTAVTANISVPTKTSDITNDSNFVVSTDLASVATSGSYADLSNKPTIDTAMSDSSTNAVQNKVIKSYVDTTAGSSAAAKVSDTAYASSWNGVTTIAPSKNAVYDKINAMDTTISGKADSSSLATVATSGSYADLTNKPTIPTVPTNVSAFNNDSGYLTSATGVTTVNGSHGAVTVQPTLVSGTNIKTINSTSLLGSGNIAVQPTISDLATIRSGASAGATAVQPGDLATVATSGSYNDLSNKPTIPAAQVNSDWNASSGVAQILNKPTIPAAQVQTDWNATSGMASIKNKPTLATVATSGSYNDLSNKPTIPTVNNGTLTINQGGTSKGTFTANQSSASTVNLETGKLVTQTEYNNISGASSDGNLYIIYKTV